MTEHEGHAFRDQCLEKGKARPVRPRVTRITLGSFHICIRDYFPHMIRFPLVLPAALALVLTSCDTVMQQSIVRAHVSVPEPPVLPILPLDADQRLVLQGGLGARMSRLPPTGLLNDSAHSRLELQLPNTSGSANLFFHYKVLFLGIEVAGRQTQVMAGTNIQLDGWQFLDWAGVGVLNYGQDVSYRQMIRTYEGDTTWRLSQDSSGMESSTLVFSAGVSAVFGTDAIRPFVAARLLTGPNIDGNGSNLLFQSSTPSASNGFDLSQGMLDAGLKIEVVPWLHAFVGAGCRTFLDKEIPGADWRLYGGLSIDLVHTDRKEAATPSQEIVDAPSRPILRPAQSPPSPIEDSAPAPFRRIHQIPSDSVIQAPGLGSGPAMPPRSTTEDSTPADIAPRTIHFQDAR